MRFFLIAFASNLVCVREFLLPGAPPPSNVMPLINPFSTAAFERIVVEVEILHFSPQRRKGREGSISVFLCVLRAFAVNQEKKGASMKREEEPPKPAILLVAFGTSVPEAQSAFDRIQAKTVEAFPGEEIRWAYTSGFIRAKLSREGRMLDSPEAALARLKDEGFSQVAVLSLHVFPGQEFHDLYRTAMLFTQMAKGFRRVVVARPLLSSYDDLVRTARALLLQIPGRRQSDEAVLFMGHGNQRHPADLVYAAMNHVLSDLSEHVYVATVQGRPSLEDFLPRLQAGKSTRAWLLPFMTVAGEHARKDMAGDGPDSWRSVLARNGIDCEVQLAGIAENPAIVEIWLDHLRDALRLFDDERAGTGGFGGGRETVKSNE